MRKWMLLGGMALASLSTQATFAHEKPEGRWQIKLLGTGVLPDGKISKIRTDLVGLPAGSQTKASDNVVPTVAIEYYATPRISLETICCTTEHHITGAGALAGADLVRNALIIPATLTVKYHLPLGPIRPYVGVGPALFLALDSKPGADAQALGVTRVHLSSEVGAALQTGADIPLGKHGYGLTFDAKKYFISTNAHFRAGDTDAIVTRHKLDPWLLSAGVYFRF
ncbi:MAG: OmpW family outer membrane protein [Sphingomonas sp.]